MKARKNKKAPKADNLKVQSPNNKFSSPDENNMAKVKSPKKAIHKVGRNIFKTRVRLELTLVLMRFPLVDLLFRLAYLYVCLLHKGRIKVLQ